MATHKSAWKRYLQSEKRRERNRSVKSALKTQVKKAREEIDSGKASPVAGEVKSAVAAIAAAKSKGVLHKRTAARRVSRLMKAAAKQGGVKKEAAATKGASKKPAKKS
jgi:small subunit ribosomal protein S20